jgi:sigma-B regulation protein RsbU (phosphoserine phosphatase)
MFVSFARSEIAPRLTDRPVHAIRTVLVVDDSRSQRLTVVAGLRSGGYTVLQAASGAEALELCARVDVDLVLSDWMMPGMTGIDLCRALRAAHPERYIYFILLTSKSEKSALTEGLGVGADDFLSKPVDTAELRARIKAGGRLLALERELRGNNQLLTDALGRLHDLYQRLDQDLAEARNLQLSLVPQKSIRMGFGQVSMRLRSAGHLGGDMVGRFTIDARRFGLYAIDVSGHGTAAALLTTRLAGLFSSDSPERNIALRPGPDGVESRPPAAVAAALHRLLLGELRSERYLTLGYAEIDGVSGAVRLVQGGHPHPVILRRDGGIERLGQGGLPLGLIDSATWVDLEAQLNPGDRLLIVSDGVIECPGRDGQDLGQEGMERVLVHLSGLRGQALIEGLIWELVRWSGSEDFPDDVSCVLYEYEGPPPPV